MSTFNGLKWIPEEITEFLNLGRLFASENTQFYYELDINTLLIINSAGFPINTPTGIGGCETRLYSCHNSTIGDLIYEINKDTLLNLSQANAPDSQPDGIGGVNDRLYLTGRTNDFIYELDLNTKLQISSASFNTNPKGIGGTQDRLYTSQSGLTNNFNELDLNTKLSINQGNTPNSDNNGQDIGGIAGKAFMTSTSNSGESYEFDLDTFVLLNTFPTPTANPRGIGGTVGDGTLGTKVIIKKASFGGNEFNLSEVFLDTKPQ